MCSGAVTGGAAGSRRLTYLRRMSRRRTKRAGVMSNWPVISSPMQRHCAGSARTMSGIMISSSTGRCSGRRGRRSWLRRGACSAGMASSVSPAADTQEAAAFPAAGSPSMPVSSSSSWAALSFSLFAPKMRRTSRSIFCRSSLVSCSSAAIRSSAVCSAVADGTSDGVVLCC